MKIRIPLKPVLGGVKNVVHSISSHEKTQENRVSCFLILQVLFISEGSVFPDYYLDHKYVSLLFYGKLI